MPGLDFCRMQREREGKGWRGRGREGEREEGGREGGGRGREIPVRLWPLFQMPGFDA
jgi:hypothetical protein